MLATLASKAFDDDDWLFEIKWDGFRMQAVVDNGKVKTWTRSLKDAETYFPNLVSPPRWIEAQQAIVDGEVVALEEDGRPSFDLLQTKLGQKGASGLVYQVFDLLYLDGRSLLNVPLEDRKRLLKSVLREHPRVRFAAHVEGEGTAFHEAATKTGLEGIVAKLRRSLYEPGRRSPAWLKIKIRPEQELVVGGWTPGSGNAKDLGAVAVGVYEDGKLRFAGKVGSGFTGGIRRDLLDRMKPLEQDDPPFDPPPPKDYRGRWGGDLKDITWVRPELVIRAELGGWTREGVVRQTSYKGIEPGRDPKTVSRETAINTTTAVRAAEAEVPPMPASKPASSSAAAGGAKSKSKSKAAAKPARGASSAGAASEFHGATPEELAALDALGNEGVWRVDGNDLKLTNLDKVLFKPRPPDDQPITKRELIRYYVTIAPTILPHLKDRPLNLNRFPNGPEGPSFWQKNIKETDPKWLTRWHETGVDGRTDRDANNHLIADGPAALALAGEPGQLRDPRLDRQTARPVAADVRVHRHRPRREDDLGRHAHAGAPLPSGPRAPRRPRLPQDDRQARHPDLDPDRAEVRLPRDKRVGRTREPSRRLDRPGADLLGVVDEEPRREGPPRLHPEREHQDAGGAVFRAALRGRAGVNADHLGRARRPRPAAGPMDDSRPAGPSREGRRPVRAGPDRPAGAAAGLRSAAAKGSTIGDDRSNLRRWMRTINRCRPARRAGAGGAPSGSTPTERTALAAAPTSITQSTCAPAAGTS